MTESSCEKDRLNNNILKQRQLSLFFAFLQEEKKEDDRSRIFSFFVDTHVFRERRTNTQKNNAQRYEARSRDVTLARHQKIGRRVFYYYFFLFDFDDVILFFIKLFCS